MAGNHCFESEALGKTGNGATLEKNCYRILLIGRRIERIRARLLIEQCKERQVEMNARNLGLFSYTKEFSPGIVKCHEILLLDVQITTNFRVSE